MLRTGSCECFDANTNLSRVGDQTCLDFADSMATDLSTSGGNGLCLHERY